MPAYSAQPLFFSSAPEKNERIQVSEYYSNNTEFNARQIALADLNEDGLEEIIVKAENCKSNHLCSYEILAGIAPNKIISLGTFSGKKLMLGREYTNGVRNILVFANPLNDYEYKVYHWSPQEKQYTRPPPPVQKITQGDVNG